MFQAQTTIAWGGALLWLLGIAAAAFLVSWVLADACTCGAPPTWQRWRRSPPP